jgi:cell envelope opacity-associated protein A
MPGRFELKPTLAKIWHAPDNFRIMDPLPNLHRRGIIIAALLVVVGFLLPSGDDSDTAPASRNAQLDIQSQSQPQRDSQPMQTQLVTPSNDPGQVAPVEPEPIQDDQPQEQAAAPQVQQPTGIDQQWRSYRVEPGKTMAQLFYGAGRRGRETAQQFAKRSDGADPPKCQRRGDRSDD